MPPNKNKQAAEVEGERLGAVEANFNSWKYRWSVYCRQTYRVCSGEMSGKKEALLQTLTA